MKLLIPYLILHLARFSISGEVGLSDYRFVGYSQLVSTSNNFTDKTQDENGGGYFKTLLFDPPRHQLIVGGRDAIYRLSLEALTQLEKAPWPADAQAVGLCTAKGQTEANCRNFVKVLVNQRDQLFACGTNAYSPACSWRNIQEISRVNKKIDGRGKCPLGPDDNSTALMTRNGDYYIAGSHDFQSNFYAIYRMSGALLKDTLRSDDNNALWMNKPDFVTSFETNRYIYFLFRETEVEQKSCGGQSSNRRRIRSKIARVCKNDKGGNMVLRNNWTTFLKARLNCSIPKVNADDLPYNFDEIRSADYVPAKNGDESDGVVYAAFANNENDAGAATSAVCAFSIGDIEAALEADFWDERNGEAVERTDADLRRFRCESAALAEDQFGVEQARAYQSVVDPVQPLTDFPLRTEVLQRYTHLTVDSVNVKFQESHPVHVVYISAISSKDNSVAVKKLSFNTKTKQTCLVEVFEPFSDKEDSSSQRILSMKFLSDLNSLYISTEDRILRIPSQRCGRFRTRNSCLNAMDPYCGWNREDKECQPTPNRNPRVGYWHQNLLGCPIMTEPVDGSWSGWSDWDDCNQFDDNYEEGVCRCRKRSCDSPKPLNGGRDCLGTHVEVSNCTRHGVWTTWSAWSACSATCNAGVRTRTRSCGNPAPAFGGRKCVGVDIDTEICANLQPCNGGSVTAVTPSTVGRWTEWSSWSECSVECGEGGFRKRTRRCLTAGTGGSCGEGCNEEFEPCSSTKCSTENKVTSWTPWMRKADNDSSKSGWYERRFSFSYQVQSRNAFPFIDPEDSPIRLEERFCAASSNRCSLTASTNKDNGLTRRWSNWSKCTKPCGGGYQVAVLGCPEGEPSCPSGRIVERACNTHACPGKWSCWGDWSVCDRTGKRQRSRDCLTEDGSLAESCDGGSNYEQVQCDGWTVWSPWDKTACASNEESAVEVRIRSCTTASCTGDDRQTRACGSEDPSSTSLAQTTGGSALFLALMIGFLLGSVFGCLLVYYIFVHRSGGCCGVRFVGGANRPAANPNYVSAKNQNLYVSLPMLDLSRGKHAFGRFGMNNSDVSDCGTLRSTTTAGNGTLRSYKGSSASNNLNGGSSVMHSQPPKVDYETATIKRSHSHRNSSLLLNGSAHMSNSVIRTDLDSDQMFS